MAFFIIVPTFYRIYKITNEKTAAQEYVIECKSKGAAVKWIHTHGETGINYHIEAVYRKQ